MVAGHRRLLGREAVPRVEWEGKRRTRMLRQRRVGGHLLRLPQVMAITVQDPELAYLHHLPTAHRCLLPVSPLQHRRLLVASVTAHRLHTVVPLPHTLPLHLTLHLLPALVFLLRHPVQRSVSVLAARTARPRHTARPLHPSPTLPLPAQPQHPVSHGIGPWTSETSLSKSDLPPNPVPDPPCISNAAHTKGDNSGTLSRPMMQQGPRRVDVPCYRMRVSWRRFRRNISDRPDRRALDRRLWLLRARRSVRVNSSLRPIWMIISG